MSYIILQHNLITQSRGGGRVGGACGVRDGGARGGVRDGEAHGGFKCSSFMSSCIVILQELARFIRVYSYLLKVNSAFTCFDRSVFECI